MDRLKKLSNKEDLRVYKTKKALEKALIEICYEKPFGKIRVKEITERAYVSRQTFYLHYETKEDILRDYLSNQYDQMFYEIRNEIKSIHQVTISEVQDFMFKNFTDNERLTRLLFSLDNQDMILDAMLEITLRIHEEFDLYSTLRVNSEKDEFQNSLKYATGGCYVLLREWAKTKDIGYIESIAKNNIRLLDR